MNYKLKKNKNNNLKYIKYYQFKIIILFIIILFSFLIYLSIPVFYNYDTYDQVLKNKINQDFKINVMNINKIEYKFLPKPYFIIHDSVINLTDANDIIKLDQFKVFVNLKNLYKKDKIQLKKIVVNKANVKFNYLDLISFHDHLQKKITKPIYIYNSNFFYYNKNEKNILISPIKKFKYFIDKKNKKKYLKTSGILFGADYKFNWIKDYNEPNFSKSYIIFKDLNLHIGNFFENDYGKNSFKSKIDIELLREKISLNYFFYKNKIEFFNNKKNLNYSNLIGKINLNPFFFNLNLNLLEFDIELIFHKLFFYLYPIQNNFHKNFNGNIIINIDKLNNKYFKNLKFNLNFQEGKLNFRNIVLTLNKIGKINISDVEYIERKNTPFLRSKFEIIIDDQDEFYKRFQVSKADRINISKIYSFVEKNIDKNEYYLGKIYFNNMSKLNNKNEDIESSFNKIENFQALSRLIKNEFKQINSD
jgi:hypothetical protein